MYIANPLATRANAIEIDANFKESIWVQLNVCDNTKIMLGCVHVYRSSSSTPDNDDKLHTLLTETNDRGPSQIIAMGNFNHPEINWVTNTTGIHRRSQLFSEAVRDAYLIQHIDEPTRYRHGQTSHKPGTDMGRPRTHQVQTWTDLAHTRHRHGQTSHTPDTDMGRTRTHLTSS